MEQIEQKAKEVLNRAKKQGEETAKALADAQMLLQDLVKTDMGTDEYDVGMEMIGALGDEFKKDRSALSDLTDAVNRLCDELRATHLPSTNVVPEGTFVTPMRRHRSSSDANEEESAESRQSRLRRRTKDPSPVRDDADFVPDSQPIMLRLKQTLPRASTVEPELAVQPTQRPSQSQYVATGDAEEFSEFTPTIQANSGKLGQKEQIRAFLNLCYAEPALTEGETTQFVDRMRIVKAISLKEMIVKSSSSLQNRKDGKVMCCPSLLSKRSAAIVEDENGEIKRKNCPTCKESDSDSDFCFSLEFVPGVYQGPTRKKEKFDLTEPSQVSSVNGQTNPKRYKLIRHT